MLSHFLNKNLQRPSEPSSCFSSFLVGLLVNTICIYFLSYISASLISPLSCGGILSFYLSYNPPYPNPKPYTYLTFPASLLSAFEMKKHSQQGSFAMSTAARQILHSLCRIVLLLSSLFIFQGWRYWFKPYYSFQHVYVYLEIVFM